MFEGVDHAVIATLRQMAAISRSVAPAARTVRLGTSEVLVLPNLDAVDDERLDALLEHPAVRTLSADQLVTSVATGTPAMAVPANTFQTYQAIGNAEDVSDRIFNITPFDTPMTTLAGNGKAEATFTEWQTETLLAVNSNNAVIEGDDAANTAVQPTVRVGNYLQISERTDRKSVV